MGRLRVLVIDDEPDLRTIAAAMLRSDGHDVQTAVDHLHVLGADPSNPSSILNIIAPISGVITDQQVTNASGVAGLGSKNFSISEAADCQNPALAPGATCHLTVTFAPKQTGLLTATIFVHDSGTGSPEIAVIQGIGTH